MQPSPISNTRKMNLDFRRFSVKQSPHGSWSKEDVLADVLIVHAAEDQDVAALLARELRATGWSTWLGDFSLPMLEAVLPRVRCTVILWSDASLSGERVAFVARRTRQHSLLSVLIDAVPVPENLSIDLSILQWSEDCAAARCRLWKATVTALAHRLQAPADAAPRTVESAAEPSSAPPPALLVLEIVNSNADWVGQNRRKTIGRAGARIGRSRECDWIIKSPYLSRIHARISMINDRYFIEGTGRTPLKLNSRQLPNYLLWELHAGDRLLLDEYEMKVTLQRAQPGMERSDPLEQLSQLARKTMPVMPTLSELTLDGDSPEWRIPAGG